MSGEKRSASETVELANREESVILLDVEGTTTSISFVQDTLFPYVREFLKKHVDEKWDDEEFKADLAKLKKQAKDDEENKVEGVVAIKDEPIEEAKESLIKNVLWQMDNDRKAGALKQLQGHMWQAAHKVIKGHVYEDVPKAFEEWTSSGKKLYIYSSGSVLAQKLLYGNTEHGDLLKYISGHFDTGVGAKQEAQSYKNILKEIGFEPSNVLFLTDVPKEAEAAKAAGLSAIIVVREGNAKLSDEDKAAFKTIESFDELSFQSPSKKQKVDEETDAAEKKDLPNEEKKTAVVEPFSIAAKIVEPMDTTDDVKVPEETKTAEKKVDDKVESKVEEPEKTAEKVNANGIIPMEEDVKSDAKSVTETDVTEETKKPAESAEKDSEKLEVKETVVSEENPKTEVPVEADKKLEEPVKKSSEPVQKVEESEKKTDEVANVVEEKVKESVTTEKVTEKSEVAEKVAEVTKTEETVSKPSEEVKENGNAKIAEVEDKVDATENKENTEEVEKKAESENKVAEVSKENESTEKAQETEDVASKDAENKLNALFSLKKSLADGAGEPDVVSPPVVAATS